MREPIFLTEQDYKTTRWSGGTTTQLAIFPAEADYADRDFLFRVSSAAVELDESDFTPLPDYRRFISTVRGDMTLSHNGGEALTLRPGDVHAFDGADATHSRGRCTDFNLMLRKGRSDGGMRALRPGAEPLSFDADARARFLLLYCAEGSCLVRADAWERRLRAGEALRLDDASGVPLTLTGEGGCLVLAAWAWETRK